ncbi:autoinducer binding domain-containing protein [Bradyrhizobium sp. 150]|nr:autoinducer binding domain-containing protein [Bradyrhizobium sp. 150]
MSATRSGGPPCQGWGEAACAPAGSRAQGQFFDEATTYGIRSGITVPMRDEW